jgi:type I restriction enzyme, S subunit
VLSRIGKFKNGLNKDSSAFGHGSPFVNLMDVFGVNAISATSHLGLVASTKTDKEVYDLRQGDVLFIRSSVKPSGVGLTVVVERDLIDTVYSGFLIRFRDDGALDNGFKKHCFYAETFRKKLIAASSVSANTNINQNALGTLTLLLPPTKDEQTAIATVLSDMDLELAALEQRRDKTRALKQGMMQELLTGRTRLV